MKVVSNSSALINLSRIGKLTLLRDAAGFRIAQELYWRVLKDEKEA